MNRAMEDASALPEGNGDSPIPSSVLFKTNDHSVILFDIPRSLEEAQVLPGQSPSRRIYSDRPTADQFPTPEPKNGTSAHWSISPAAHVADLMAAATAENALSQLNCRYSGPFYLPRLYRPDTTAEPTTSSGGSERPMYIPQGATYTNGLIRDTRREFIKQSPEFDLIVLDPPWPNRSVRRTTNGYQTATNLDEMKDLLLDIPVQSRLALNGLVAIWITNKPSIYDLLTSPTGILTSWGLEVAAEWTWLKIAASGEPLFDISSTWRKPWERLIIAKRRNAKTPSGLSPRVIIAVPDKHSRKPNLRGLFRDVLGNQYTGLEVFARNLTAGWWSWGNEVLHFQEPQHWCDFEVDA